MEKLKKGAVFLFIVFMTLPIVTIAVYSVGKGWFGARFLPESFGLDWYGWALAVTDLLQVILNTLIIAVLALAVTFVAVIPAAWFLGRGRPRGKGVWLAILLLPRMLPPITFALGLAKIFYSSGLTDTHFGVALAHVVLTLPYALLILVTTFEGIDERLLEAARVCGASGYVFLRRIILPLSKPGLLAALFLAFTTSYNEFTLTIMTYGPRTVTLPVMTYLTIGDGFWEVSSALSMILLLPSALVLVFIIRGMTGGRLIGGLKGL